MWLLFRLIRSYESFTTRSRVRAPYRAFLFFWGLMLMFVMFALPTASIINSVVNRWFIQAVTMRPISRVSLRPYICPSCRSGAISARRRFASKAEPIPDIYDVVCVGGGPAGLGLLAALSMPVLEFAARKDSNKLRVIACYVETKSRAH